MSARSPDRDDGYVTLGCFEVGGRVYAVDVSHVREVVRWQAPAPLPGASAPIEGVIDLRGAALPVVDVGLALGGAPVIVGPRARIVVTERHGAALGLAVDAAIEVLSVESGSLEEPAPPDSEHGAAAGRALVRRARGAPIIVLSLDALLAGVDGAMGSVGPTAGAVGKSS